MILSSATGFAPPWGRESSILLNLSFVELLMALNPSPQVPNLFKYPSGNLGSIEPDTGGGASAPEAVSDLAVTSIGSTGASLSWSLPASAENIEVYQRDVTASGSFTLAATLGSVESYSATGLDPENEYEWKLVATNDAGDSGDSNVVSGTTEAVSAPSGFVQFAEGYYEPSNLEKRIVSPRPLAETASHSRARRHYPGILWRIPVECTGLARPVHYSVEGPSGMQFAESFVVYDSESGTYEDGIDVGMLEWANPTLGTHEYTITCQGQNGAGDVLTVTNELTVTETGTGFAASDGDDANPGTLAQPKRNLEAFCDGNYPGWHICARAGTYQPMANVSFSGANNPKVLYGYPGEEVIFNGRGDTVSETGGIVLISGGSSGDTSISNIKFDQSKTFGDSRFIYYTASLPSDRHWIYDVTFSRFDWNGVGGENPAPITIYDYGSYRTDWVIRNIELDNVSVDSTTAALGSFYNIEHAVVSHIKFNDGINAQRGVFFKGPTRNAECYSVDASLPNFTAGAFVCGLSDPSDLIEIQYCKLGSRDNSADLALRWQQSANAGNSQSRVYIQRNSGRGRFGYGGSTGGYDSEIELTNNILVSDSASELIQPSTEDTVVTSVGNITGDSADNLLDENLNLGSGGLQYLGQKGATYADGN